MNNRLRALRAERGWSQQHLGDLLEVSRQSVNAIETGRYDPSLPLAFRIAELFIEATRVLIQHCLSPEAGGYSASDFADAGLDDEGVQDLLLELGGGGVGVGGALFEAVVLAHRLVVEILSVDHEQHFLNARHPRGKLRGFEAGERLAGPGRVPHVTAGCI